MSYLADLERKYIAVLERIKEVEAENAALRAKIDELGIVPDVPRCLKLTKKEAGVLTGLMKRARATKEQLLYDGWYDGVTDEPDLKIVDVFICKLRGKLGKFELKIDTEWGFGYSLPKETRAAIRRMSRAEAGLESMGDRDAV